MSLSTTPGTSPPTPLIYEYVFAISRAGQRTPTTPCTLLPQVKSEACGQLTTVGREELCKLGCLFRTRYSGLLTGQPGEVLASYVKNPRSCESVYVVLSAMDAHDASVLQDHTDYTDLYESTLASHYDIIMGRMCRGQFLTFGDMINFVCKKMGSPTNNQWVKFMCLDSLITYVINGYPIPDWALPHWDDILWADRTLFEMSMVGCEKRMAAPVLEQVLDILVEKYEIRGTRKDKMRLFVVSDTILFSVLKLFNCFYDARPAFCATLLIELYRRQDGEGTQVRVLFGNTLRPILLRLDWMSNPCSVATFITGLRRILTSDYSYNVHTGRTWPVSPTGSEERTDLSSEPDLSYSSPPC